MVNDKLCCLELLKNDETDFFYVSKLSINIITKYNILFTELLDATVYIIQEWI